MQVDSFIINSDELTEETKARISSKLLQTGEEGGDRAVDPETQARLQSLLKAAGSFAESRDRLLVVYYPFVAGNSKCFC